MGVPLGSLLDVPGTDPTLRPLLLLPVVVAAVIRGRFVAVGPLEAVVVVVFTESTMISGVPALALDPVWSVLDARLVAVEVVPVAGAADPGRMEGRVEESAFSTRIWRPLRSVPLRAVMLFSTPAASAMVMKPKQVGLFLFLVV